MEADIMDFGGRVIAVRAPDHTGEPDDVILGLEHQEEYLHDQVFLGALVGRYANRIARGSLVLNGREHEPALNNGAHTLHGGPEGFHRQVWQARATSTTLHLSYLSPDGQQGFPGTLVVEVTYTLTDNSLHIAYSAVCDADTVINLSSHCYFNLAGRASASILAHRLQIHADEYLAVDAGLIPTGELRRVAGTPFDFRQPRALGQNIGDDDEQVRLARGYDHTYALRGWDGSMRLAASLLDPLTGRYMEVLTTEPGLHLYSGNYLDGSARGRGGLPLRAHSGLCLETQHYPDSPNHPHFPTTVLKAGQRFASASEYRFTCHRPSS
jgi:aldose 1-epimerase